MKYYSMECVYYGLFVCEVDLCTTDFTLRWIFLFQLRKVVQEWPMVLLPSHRSYLDFLLVSYIMFEYNIKLPCIAAGQGMLFTCIRSSSIL